MPDAAARARAAEAEVEAELVGWVHVANELLLDGARQTLARVEEPSRRAEVQAAYVEGLAALLHSHAATVSAALFAAAAEAAAQAELEEARAAERGRADAAVRELARQKLALEQEVAALQEEARRAAEAVGAARLDADTVQGAVAQERQALESLRAEEARQREEHERCMSAARQELQQAQAEFAAERQRAQAVRQQLRLLAATLAQLRDGDEAAAAAAAAKAEGEGGEEPMAYEEPSESLRQLLEELVEYAAVAQRTQQELQDEAAQLREQLLAAQEPPPRHSGPQPLYQRILPPPAVSPAARTLQSVREQVRELRPQSALTPCGVVNTPRLSNRRQQQHFCGVVRGEAPAASSLGPLYRTPNARLPEEAPSPVTAWRERMAALRAELHDLRREIGS
ncbi:uncharacterized protein Tco025E_05496 [Trypanosoma conorhini]|uniref:Uncharacterized protein n=1 Tax=Trypanosoma conorhini TaxID=83891 RepID=A0A3R7L3D8_9TRYP|nr:uncharacterized protein Tco025E_05496 [Trypanosoma conorhini]RNF15525.1 hypothetical protein Tco025E_05496 [Trypanosoma conorhini]